MSEQITLVQTGSRVWRDPRNGKVYKASAPGVFEAQAIMPEDISAIEAQVVMEEVLGLARPRYTLRNVCRIIPMVKLVANFDVATKLTGQEKVPPMVEAEISAEDYSRVAFDLWKNVVHVVVSDEARMKPSHNVLALNTEDASKELPRMENKQIGELLATATEVAGSDWGVRTSPPTSDNDPFVDIIGVMTTLESAGYYVDFMAMHPLVWGDFITNSYVKDLVHAGIARVGPTGGDFTLPGFPTVRCYTDYGCTPNTSAFLGSSRANATVLGDGPTESARYRNEKAGYDAFIIRQWLEPKIVLGDAIRELTGVHA
ncbi:MAG: hypothetical protein NWF13_06720 [Candidatus Bathyarchaeota archaeon]|nr:hypothetical protein [Candidatus Bathyarchaeota archaeon]